MSSPDLAALLPSWELALRAELKSPQTVKSYGDGVRWFLDWCARTKHRPVLDRATVAAFVADLLRTAPSPPPPAPATSPCAGSPRGWSTRTRPTPTC